MSLIHNFEVNITKTEEVDFIVPERLVEARKARCVSFEEASEILEIPKHELGLIENGHVKDIPKEILFKYMSAFHFPRGFFYRVRWKRV